MREVERVRYLVLAAQREGNRQLTRDLRPHGLTAAQAEVLRILGDHGPLTLNGLGSMLVCESGSNPSRLVDRLVAAGLVERSAGTADRRNVTLDLTAEGREVEGAVRAVEERLYDDIERALRGADVGGLIRALETLTEGSSTNRALRARIAAQSAGNEEASRPSDSASGDPSPPARPPGTWLPRVTAALRPCCSASAPTWSSPRGPARPEV